MFALKTLDNELEVQLEHDIANALKDDSHYLSLIHCSVPILTKGFMLIHHYHPGGDLYNKIYNMKTERASLSTLQLQTIMAELIVGLKKLHKVGFVHCDIKPCNVMIDSYGHVIIIDFNLARRISEMKSYWPSGTKEYFSPEMINWEKIPPGCESAQDWWALGIFFSKLMRCTPILISSVDHVLKALLNKNVKNRMLFEYQPFFKGINWDQVRQRTIKPPFTNRHVNERRI